jgi:hypothetical protein
LASNLGIRLGGWEEMSYREENKEEIIGSGQFSLSLSLSLSISHSVILFRSRFILLLFYFLQFLLCVKVFITLHVTKRNLVLSAKFVYFNSTKETNKQRILCYYFPNWDIVYRFLFWYLIVILINDYVKQIDVCKYTYWKGKK